MNIDFQSNLCNFCVIAVCRWTYTEIIFVSQYVQKDSETLLKAQRHVLK